MGFGFKCLHPIFQFSFLVSNQSIPIIPWTNDQESALSSQLFRQLLEILGFHLHPESGKIYPRIPNFWGPDVLFEVAQKLGNIQQGKLLKKMFCIIHFHEGFGV